MPQEKFGELQVRGISLFQRSSFLVCWEDEKLVRLSTTHVQASVNNLVRNYKLINGGSHETRARQGHSSFSFVSKIWDDD